MDNPAIGEMAANHLMHRGYPHFAFIGWSSLTWSVLRADGFENALRRNGQSCLRHELLPKKFPVSGDSNLERRFTILHSILCSLPRPCGIFAANDALASLLIRVARFHNMGIPSPFGILGVDNNPLAIATSGMAISSIENPFREVGYRGVEMLDRLRKGHPGSSCIKIPPVRVVTRTSTNAFITNDPLVRNAQAYIEKYREKALRVSDLVRALHTTAPTLNKHFSQVIDMSPSEYILGRRLEHARDMLRTGNYSVDEVAERCGFSSRCYFGDLFKRKLGITPGSVRRREG